MKKHKLSFVGLALLALVGCSPVRRGVFDSYPFQYQEKSSSYPNLEIFSKEIGGGYVKFKDTNFDGRFDVIKLRHVKNGDLVEKYANLETGQRIAESFKEYESVIPSLKR